MADRSYGLNGTPGAALSQANSGATQVVPQGGSATYSTDLVVEGTTGAKFVSAANQLSIARFVAGASSLTMSDAVAFMVPANPARSWINFHSLRGSGAPLKANWNANGTLDVRDQNNANPVAFSGSYVLGRPYWLTIRAKVATATTGTFTANIYDLTTGVLVGTASSGAYNLGTVAITGGDIGIVNSDPSAGDTAYFDYLRFNDGSTVEIPPPITAPAYSGADSTSSGTAAVGSGVAATAGTAATSVVTGASAASAITTAGTAATSSGATGAGVGAPRPAATAATSVEAAASGTGRPAVPGTNVTSATTTASASGKAAVSGTVATSAGVDASGSGASSEGGAGSATTSNGTTALASGRPTLRGASSTSVRTTATAATLASLAGAAATSSGSTTSGGGLVASNGEAVTSVEVVTVAAGAVPAERHDVDVAAWLARPRYAAALGATRYDGTIKPNRWRAKL